jgi:hypothetical protein
MDKNKFWLGGRLFNTASPRLGAQRNARHVRKLGAPTQHKACPQVGRPNATHVRNLDAPQRKDGAQTARRVRKMGGNVRKLGAQRNANTRHVRKLGTPTQRKARPQDGRPNAKLIRNENVHTREH